MKEVKNKHNRWINQDTDALFGVILKLKDVDEARRFFRDLLTEKELVELGQRWKVARMLAKRMRYTKIAQETGMSSTTIARVHKWLKKGMGGYKLILERLKENR
ncbi:MAG: YerC/YecD family TrpR-related protein [Candidatus Jorgensenbacteria bacterium]